MGERERARLRARILLLAGLVPLLCAQPARADLVDTGGAGVFVGYVFGKGGGVEWGLEGFATHFTNPGGACADVSEHRTGVGPLLRVSLMGSKSQLTVAAHGGAELATTDGGLGLHSFTSLDAELGIRVLMEEPNKQRAALHTGATLESAFFNFYLRQAWLLEAGELAPAVSVGGGARYAPTFGLPSTCATSRITVGRPCRDHAGREQRVRVRGSTRFDRRAPRAVTWAKRAAEESASVPAFLQLALELLELDAPLALVQRAVAAADEELGHTRAALHLAYLLGGGSVCLLPPPFRPRASLPRPLALARLAQEAWVDGCLNEGLAAGIAATEAASSPNEAEVSASLRIASEETGHARLARDVLFWAVRESVNAREASATDRGGSFALTTTTQRRPSSAFLCER